MEILHKYFSSKKYMILFFVSSLMCIATMTVIFGFSSQNSAVSSDTSGFTILHILKCVYPKFNSLTQNAKDTLIENLQFFIRKLAHFSVYCALGFFAQTSLLCVRPLSKKKKTIISFILSLVYAVSDELHQLFVPGRACRIFDVAVDSAGAILGILISLMIFLIFQKKRQHKTIRY